MWDPWGSAAPRVADCCILCPVFDGPPQELNSVPSVRTSTHLQNLLANSTDHTYSTSMSACEWLANELSRRLSTLVCGWRYVRTQFLAPPIVNGKQDTVRYRPDKCAECGHTRTLWLVFKFYIRCPVGGMSKQQSTKTITRKVMHMILWLKSAVEIEKKIQALKTQFR
jgi:hypothetical protein